MKNTFKTDMLDIIFANRNQAYGAYQIRRAYPGYLMRAFFAGVLLIALLGLLPRLLSGVMEQAKLLIVDEGRDLTNIVVEKNTPPPPKMQIAAPPPVQKASVRFVPPKIVSNDQPDPKTSLSIVEIETQLAPVGKVTAGGDIPDPIFPDPGEIFGDNTGSGRAVQVDTIMDLITVEKMPSFPGGDAELMKFITENIYYPEIARETNIQGTVAVTFVVGKDGKARDIKVIKDIGGGCGKEAVRVINKMPYWIPGEANGHVVNVRFTLPVRFRLQ